MSESRASAVSFDLEFLRELEGVMIVDASRERIFTSIGEMRGAFRGCSSWPPLSECGPPGRADEIEDARSHGPLDAGRLVRIGTANQTMALRFLSAEIRDGGYTTIGVDLKDYNANSSMIRTQRAPQHAAADAKSVPHALRLHGRAEQCLWALHQQLLRQRCSFVQMPDLWFARCVWGSRSGDWPANWRRDLFDVLWSLEQLKIVNVFGNIQRGFEVGEISSLVAGVSDGRHVRAEDHCDEHCPLRSSDIKHHHFRVQVGMGFLGVLEGFKVQDGPRRYFNFNPDPNDVSDQVEHARQSGAIIPVSPLLKICGPSPNGPFTRAQRRVLSALVREVTRAPRSSRSDKARVIRGNRVVGADNKSELACPLLSASENFVTFGGNGRRPGMGYRILGVNERGWLRKCGYGTPAADSAFSAEVRRFLTDLDALVRALGFVVVGLLPATEKWLSLETMTALARGNRGWLNLDEVHLRVYARANYQERLEGAFTRTRQGNARRRRRGLSTRSSSRRTELEAQSTEQLLTLARISNQELAKHLNVSEAFVSQTRSGRKPWPTFRDRCARTLALKRLRLA